jgi:hypothetical protein
MLLSFWPTPVKMLAISRMLPLASRLNTQAVQEALRAGIVR